GIPPARDHLPAGCALGRCGRRVGRGGGVRFRPRCPAPARPGRRGCVRYRGRDPRGRARDRAVARRARRHGPRPGRGAGVARRAYGLFRDVETPDRELVERCIAAYGHQSDDGRWRLRDEDALVRRQADQTLLVIQLLDAGRRLGFKVHVGRDLERRALPEAHLDRGRVLGDLMTDAERTADISREARIHSDALDYVDCLWYDKGRMVFMWQLEWTAR